MRILYLVAAAVLAGLLALFLSTGNQQQTLSVPQQAFNTTELEKKFKGTEVITSSSAALPPR
jgi:hypothetical protein